MSRTAVGPALRVAACGSVPGVVCVATQGQAVSPVTESPSNAELGTIANWNLVLTTTNRVRAICVRANG